MDFGAGLRAGRSLEGQLLFVVGTEAGTLAARGKSGRSAPKDAGTRARMGTAVPARPPGQKQSPPWPVSGASGPGSRPADGGAGNLYPPRAAPGRSRD